MKSGYLYVLVHPSDPNLYKVGQTTRHPEERLVEHNSNYAEYAGRSSKRPVRNGSSKNTLPSPIQVGPKMLFGEQRDSQNSRFDKELKLRGWNGN
jgi:hypothetical protein